MTTRATPPASQPHHTWRGRRRSRRPPRAGRRNVPADPTGAAGSRLRSKGSERGGSGRGARAGVPGVAGAWAGASSSPPGPLPPTSPSLYVLLLPSEGWRIALSNTWRAKRSPTSEVVGHAGTVLRSTGLVGGVGSLPGWRPSVRVAVSSAADWGRAPNAQPRRLTAGAIGRSGAGLQSTAASGQIV